VYGYLNQIRSSRRLEREAQRNVELLWLLNRLRPDFKTIADFRKDNGEGIVGVCRAFTLFCREQSLFGAQLVAIDGSKFQAVASRKQIWSAKRLERVSKAIDEKVEQYLRQMDQGDAQEPAQSQEDTQAALQKLLEQKEHLQSLAQRLGASGEPHVIPTEPEAKPMRMAAGQTAAAYNIQSAVDAQHSLIVAFEVSDAGNDRQALAGMAEQAKEALGVEALVVVADSGYDNAQQMAQCEALNITPIVPAQRTSNTAGEGLFHKDRFEYQGQQDVYRCPAGELLKRTRLDLVNQRVIYSTRACAGCALRPQCTAGQYRSVQRLIFAEAGARAHQRAKDHPDLLRKRSAAVEHPFAGMKYIMGGFARFLVRGMKKVKTEVALSVLGYNLKRVINLRGASAMISAWS
jgi:transposase